MKSLKLHLDDLAVETFVTTPPSTGRGTVHGAHYSEPGATCENSCAECWPVYEPTLTSCNTQPSQVYTCIAESECMQTHCAYTCNAC